MRLLLLLAALLPLPASALEQVALQLKWKHQFQFAGYYAAQEKGFYREAGFEVRIVEAQPEEDPVDAVVRGGADFGLVDEPAGFLFHQQLQRLADAQLA